MKLKLSLIGLALLATVGFASAQNNTAVKPKAAKVEKSCCTESAQKTTVDKKDMKSASCCDKKVEKKAACCEGVKAAEVKSVTENCSGCEKNATTTSKSTTAPAKRTTVPAKNAAVPAKTIKK